MATTLRQNKVVIINHFTRHPMTAPWHEAARRYGWGSCGAFPVTRGGDTYAVLAVYHELDDFFDPATVDLLDTLARDIGFALDNFDRDHQRRQALEALQDSEQHFRAYFERSMLGMAATRPDRTWMEVNQALCDMLGYSAEELTALTWEQLTHRDDLAENNRLFQQLLNRERDEYVLEKRFIHRSGRSRLCPSGRQGRVQYATVSWPISCPSLRTSPSANSPNAAKNCGGSPWSRWPGAGRCRTSCCRW